MDHHWLTAPASTELESIRDSLASFLRDARSVARLRAVLDGAAATDRAEWRALAQLGVTQALVGEELGGIGLALRDVLVIAEEIGKALSPSAVVGGAFQPTVLLRQLPPGPRRDELLAQIAAGQCIAGVAWQDDDGPAGATTIDVEGRMRGGKRYVAPGPGADGWLVTASQAGTDHLVWIDAAAPGLLVEPLARSDGATLVRLEFGDVPTRSEDRLGSGEAVTRMVANANDAARLAYAAQLLGVARSALALTLEYLKTRQQFGKPIGSFQAMQHKAADVHLKVEIAAACLKDAVDSAAAEPARLPAEAARAKARASDAALGAARFVIQAHGAMGITHECDAGLHLKKALHLVSHLGTPGELRRAHFRFATAGAVAHEESEARDLPSGADLEAVSEADFRAAVREFVRRNCPPGLLHLPRSPTWPEYQPWYQTLARKGWIAPAWPREHGGLSLSPGRLLAFYEELENMGVTKGNELGLSMVGPLLIKYGSKEQQQRYLPRILSGDDVWCQGYSEPGSGSDLASLRTSAVLEGDEYVVTGQKIWTTYAMHATHIFMLVRTARAERRQDGISFLLVKLDTPGIRVRPIKDVGGHEKFCEVFFDQARVPVSSLVGQADKGWDMAKALLGYERLMIGSPKQSIYMLGQLRELGQARGLFRQGEFANEFAELQLDVRDLQAFYRHFADIFRRGEPIPPSIAALKIAATETWQRICERFVEHAGEAGGSLGTQAFAGSEFDPLAQLMLCLPGPIYGGTNEIQRNILAKAVLGLPG